MMKDTLKLLSVHWGPTVLQSWLPTSSFTVEAPGPRVTVCEKHSHQCDYGPDTVMGIRKLMHSACPGGVSIQMSGDVWD